ELCPKLGDRLQLAAANTVRSLQIEHRLSGDLGKRHQAGVVPKLRQAPQVLVDTSGEALFEDIFMKDGWNLLHPALGAHRRTVAARQILLDNITERREQMAREVLRGSSSRVALPHGKPVAAPFLECRTDVLQALQTEKVGCQGNDHVVARQERSPAQSPQTRAHVDHHPVRFNRRSRLVGKEVERSSYVQGPLLGRRAGPLLRQGLLESRETQVTREEPQIVCNLDEAWIEDIPCPPPDRVDTAGHCTPGDSLFLLPDPGELLLAQED